ncbi:MAG: hypothetical protein IRZ06_10370 [Nevskia sp.]|nr:hypothetical protein [Nevskia sp.]
MKRATMLMLVLLAAGWEARQPARAEPYLAVRTGLPCASCHVNPTGGGMRSAFGDSYAQTQMPQFRFDPAQEKLWLGQVNDFLRAGGDLRYDASFTDVPHQKRSDAFGIEDFRVFGAASFLKDRVTLYVDQLLAPGGALTREAYVLLWTPARQFYLKAGKLYLPYGLRLQDDGAFVRQASGIDYATPDNGVELGWQHGAWSAQLAASNGAGGGNETDQGKQGTASLVYVRPLWRLGGSFNFNDAGSGKRQQQALFAGLETGPIAWLAEGDYLIDGSVNPRRKLWAGLVEANWGFLRGHNLKFTAEHFDPDLEVAHDQQNRFSLVWEYTPLPFVQTRLGVRRYGGIPQNDLQNRKLVFLELHGFF